MLAPLLWNLVLFAAIGAALGLSLRLSSVERRSPLDLTPAGLVVVVALATALAAMAGEAPWPPLAWLTGAAAWVAAWGMLTDRRPMVRGLRALAVVSAAAALHCAGVRLDSVKLPFSATFVPLGWWALPVAASWMWLCATLFARAGTLPGVAYGVSAVAWFSLLVVCWLQPSVTGPTVTLLAQAMGAASLLLFVAARVLRFAPGTAAPHLLGFLFGAASIMGALKNTAFLAAVLPLLLISVPLLGATYSYVVDLRRGRGRMALTQGREHLHQLLLRQGYSPRQVAELLTAGAAWCGLLAILLVLLIEVHFGLKALMIVAWLALGFAAGYVVLRFLPRPRAETPDSVHLLGVRITPVSMDEALARARGFVAEGSPHMIVTSDASGVVAAHDDPELREIMEQADIVTADGQGVVLAARLLNVPVRDRVSGVDMVQRLCEVAAEHSRPVFLLGAAEGVAEAAAERLQAAVPGLRIAGTQHGYFTPEEEPAVIARIREAEPAVLFVAFGIPRQEKWIRAHLEELGVPVCIGVGGSFDVLSGRLKRAPLWMRRCGLEWLYRVTQEPKRLPRLKALPRIVWLTVMELLKADDGR